MGDNQSPELFGQTPAQTVGPFFHYALPIRGGADLTGSSDLGVRPDLVPGDHDQLIGRVARAPLAGEPIEIAGRVLDGAGEPAADAMVEIWQADREGVYDDRGFGRAATLDDGSFRFRTVRPGVVAGQKGQSQAPHIAMGVFGRGLLKRLVTRLYFEDSPELDHDPILRLVPPRRRHTLIARPRDGAWRFDIVLQGASETVFFDW